MPQCSMVSFRVRAFCKYHWRKTIPLLAAAMRLAASRHGNSANSSITPRHLKEELRTVFTPQASNAQLPGKCCHTAAKFLPDHRRRWQLFSPVGHWAPSLGQFLGHRFLVLVTNWPRCVNHGDVFFPLYITSLLLRGKRVKSKDKKERNICETS